MPPAWPTCLLCAAYAAAARLACLSGASEAPLLQVVPELEGGGLSAPFSRNTPAETVDAFRKALLHVHEDGRYEAIVRKWTAL
ncbi:MULTISPECIES: hypothetical protein [Pseudomonas]|uniref:Solute-binding protein family 3/N-terminal domain-containing protein n=1 Tax=Pseudomonas quercus TaxID=2722792 RepID=A0ABX0Y8X7_9PSED|nr:MULTISPECIES: hypothetical protein [Pseudomonas]MBF7140835.1 hypothetical protein [Pseudomonas sp. LY10J]NJO99371.1 hypothetical protein [Pseudomonas quercus]